MFDALISSGYKQNEPGGDQRIGILRLQFVAGQLLANEPIVGQVAVERANNVIAIAVGIGP